MAMMFSNMPVATEEQFFPAGGFNPLNINEEVSAWPDGIKNKLDEDKSIYMVLSNCNVT
jgi:hypothetical protein